MTSRDRVLVEILVPAPLGTALLILWNLHQFIRMGIVSWPIYLLFAYVFAIVPSCIYALMLELSIRRGWWRRVGPFGFIGFSTALGTGAGAVIWPPLEAQVVGIGAIVGLLLGILLSGAAKMPPFRLTSDSAA